MALRVMLIQLVATYTCRITEATNFAWPSVAPNLTAKCVPASVRGPSRSAAASLQLAGLQWTARF